MSTTTIDARPHLALALDVSDLNEAVRLAKAVSPHMGVAKVGLQLFSAVGPRAVEAIRDTGLDVFLDVKLHDIPNTVGAAARVLGSLGARFLTIHASGGEAMTASRRRRPCGGRQPGRTARPRSPPAPTSSSSVAPSPVPRTRPAQQPTSQRTFRRHSRQPSPTTPTQHRHPTDSPEPARD